MLVSYLAALLFCAAQEPIRLDREIAALAERLVRKVTVRDPAARGLWLELFQKAPTHPGLAETLPALPPIPFVSGTTIPTVPLKTLASSSRNPIASGTLISTDVVLEDGLPGHLALPAPNGIRLLMENEAEILVNLDPSGVAATTISKPGKEIITWSDDVVGIKWSATNPEPLKLSDIRKALGVKGPTMERYHDAVYWLPDNHVAFAGDVWSFKDIKLRASYRRGDSPWGDAFFQAQPAPKCRNNLRTRIASGADGYDAVCFCPRDATPQVALIWMSRKTLKGRYLSPIEVLEQDSATIPFDFVPWGLSRQPVLLVISKNRVPVLMRLSSEGAEEVANGARVPDELVIGAPTWCDINKDGLLEIVAPVTDEEGALSIVVLLAEPKPEDSTGK
ncbi:MAG: hypothetical protein IPN34_14770 [Planctomycetes bacterium]|nr:hypothetical protein [Planctomycetota bacterium]